MNNYEMTVSPLTAENDFYSPINNKNETDISKLSLLCNNVFEEILNKCDYESLKTLKQTSKLFDKWVSYDKNFDLKNILAQMEECIEPLTEGDKNWALFIVCKSFFKMDQMEEAKKILGLITYDYVKAEVLFMIALKEVNGDISALKEIATSISDEDVQYNFRAAIAKKLIEMNDTKGAEEIMKSFYDEPLKFEDIEFLEIIEKQIESKNYSGAQETIKLMNSSSFVFQAYLMIAKEQLTTNNSEASKETIDLLCNYTMNLNETPPELEKFKQMQKQIESKNYSDAKKNINHSIHDLTMLTNTTNRNLAYLEVLRRDLEDNKLDKAKKTVMNFTGYDKVEALELIFNFVNKQQKNQQKMIKFEELFEKELTSL